MDQDDGGEDGGDEEGGEEEGGEYEWENTYFQAKGCLTVQEHFVYSMHSYLYMVVVVVLANLGRHDGGGSERSGKRV
jgi:hypothetical protein